MSERSEGRERMPGRTGMGAAVAAATGNRWARVAAYGVAIALLLSAPLVLSVFRLDLLSKYLCYAILAVGIGLAWGRGGMMTLGQGVFFGLGGYAMAMHLKIADAGPGKVPDFMQWSGVETLPVLWKPFASPVVALVAVLVVPTLAAVLIGLLVFRQRVRGAYFAVLSQALAAAFVILLVGQQGLTGGTNGLTNIRYFFGLDLYEDSARRVVYFLILAALGVVFLLASQLVRSRFGKLLVAVRDGEDRVRFLGYDPAIVKTVAFGASALMAGIAGALYVPAVTAINPSLLGVVPSIEMLIGVALGGRFLLAGAVGGALLFAYTRTTLSESWPEGWTYLQGALFVVVILWAPRGLAGLIGDAAGRLRHRRRPPPAPTPAALVPVVRTPETQGVPS